MITTTRARHPRTLGNYALITGARFADDTLFVAFADGEEVRLPVARLENPYTRGLAPDWPRARAGTHEVRVPTAGEDLGIPWDTIRALTDPRFAETWSEFRLRASETLGDGIRRLRIARGLSQDELASRAGVTSGAIADLEAGQSPADLEVAARVLPVMDCTLDDLRDAE